MREHFNTPILFIIFNRPDKTRRVFAEIKKVRPARLFITADGPRENKPEDTELCHLTREAVKNIDWPCEVKTLFREKNAGTTIVGPSAIRWFFDNVDRGIILEDDGLPDLSFFPYCEELLEKYKDDPRIMHISGNNFQQNNKNFKCDGDYYFSRITRIWGWATWKRAWDLFDNDMKLWPKARAEKRLCKIFPDSAVAYRWGYLFDQSTEDRFNPISQARIDWDGRWLFSCLMNGGLAISPRVNLVSNIGFDSEARIARNPSDETANVPARSVNIPLSHSKTFKVNEQADNYDYKYTFNINRHPSQKLKWFFKSKFTKPYLLLKKIYYRIYLNKDYNDGEKLLIC